MNEYVKLSMKKFELNPLNYVSHPGYSFDCWLMSSGVTLDTLKDKLMLEDFVEAKRGAICGIVGDRYNNIGNGNANANGIKSSNGIGNGNQGTCFADGNDKRFHPQPTAEDNDNGKTIREPASQIWYKDANNLYGYAMMQKLPYSDFKYTDTSIEVILNGYYIVCDINNTKSCKDRAE